MTSDLESAPAAFQAAVRSLSRARTRPDVRLTEVPPPQHIAPYAAAVEGQLHAEGVTASGRFVALHDPEGQSAWSGDFRIVILVRAEVDVEVGGDDMWDQAAWAWLEEALADAPHHSRGGTITKVESRSFGTLADKPSQVTVEMRVSWTPVGEDLEAHVVAWTELIALCGGVPPVPEGVAVLPGRV